MMKIKHHIKGCAAAAFNPNMLKDDVQIEDIFKSLMHSSNLLLIWAA
jgi:hypothetical protein